MRGRATAAPAAAMLLCAAATAAPADGTLSIDETYCEYAVDPLGVDARVPRLSWVLGSTRRARLQTAYQVLVASTRQSLDADAGDKWDSGKVRSDRSVNVRHGGSPLRSREACHWKVRVWDDDDRPGPWSAVATFEMGLLDPADWQAQWIEAPPAPPSLPHVPGRFGQAVSLDGSSQCVRIAHHAALKPEREITLAAWVQPDDAQGDAWREIYRKDDGPARHLLALGTTGAVTGVWVGLGIGGAYVEFGAPVSLAALKDGRWHHLAATYDGAMLRLFVDGAPVGSRPQSGALDAGGTQPAYIGSNRGTSELFSGAIDDMRVYRRALTGADVQALLGEARGPEPHLVGWWQLDRDLINAVSGLAGEAVSSGLPAPHFRKELQVAAPVRRARVFLAGLGWSELFINGARVSDHVLDPAATDYDRRVLYATHDVTALLRPGPNALGVLLGNGWFSEPPAPGYGNAPRLRLQLHLDFADGTTAVVTSDPTWRTASGPILRNDLFGGETYDARLERPGWMQPGYNDAAWAAAVVAPPPGGVLESQAMPPIRVVETLRPIALSSPAPGVHVYDFGQLFGGWTRFHVKGPGGKRVTLKYSPCVFADTGLVDKRRHPPPKETDEYILRGDPAGEVYEPRFTFHPVRYVQIEGDPGAPALDRLEGRVVHSAVDLTGEFQCSNELFNRIHRNAVWTLRNELYGFPLDCLHREPWGWLEPGTNPSMLFARQHLPLFWEKFLKDARAAQHPDGVIPDVVPNYPLKGRKTGDPAWAGNYPLLVWYLYQVHDDVRLLEDHYEAMRKWLEHLVSISSGCLITTGYYGDHMLPGDAPGEEQFISRETPPALLWSGYYHRNAAIVASAAKVLGRAADAERYSELAASIHAAINAQWFDPATGSYATGSQTANLAPLAFGIVPEGREPDVIARIAASIVARGHHLRTGNLGTACLMDASLASRGQGQLLYEVMNQTTYPGYGYMVDQGATTLWEAWSVRDDLGSGEESMGMWGTVEELFYRDLAGIGGPAYFGPRSFAPGFREVEIRPHVLGDLTHASASIRTVRGRVSSRWRIAGDTFRLEVRIPAGGSARVSVPRCGAGAVVREGDRVVWDGAAFVPGTDGVTAARRDGDRVVFAIGSGEYGFSVSGHGLPR